ncbi:hypothetical protein, partial [Klebsiella pneumoniae]|uniref:hypothetical protein n=1 Tax=Klebsiella pneumoniae TaxID=573 RepID=UPI001C6976D1
NAVPFPACLFATSPLSLRYVPSLSGASLVMFASMAVSMPPGLKGGFVNSCYDSFNGIAMKES